ncbi:MAG: hypothetical protein RLZZ505_2336 [Verrucomicrobiota bacterium]|jgi:hypothetical protein
MKPKTLAQVAATFFALSSGVRALSFDFTFTPTSSTADIAGFNAAANFWSSRFTDNVIIRMDVGTSALAPNVLAQAGSTQGTTSFSDFRNFLSADATSAFDTQAVASLSAGSSFNMLLNRTSNNPNGAGSPIAYVDNDGDANNSKINLTTANAKALGYSVPDTVTDAEITFSNSFPWDYDRSDGITSGTYDFVGIAIHEIGHALGFISGVDVLDGNSTSPNFFSDELFTFVSPLDLFRYSTASTALGVIDWSAGTEVKYFSLDKGVTNLGGFSTGSVHGDGQQASHWKDNLGLGILDPTAAQGELLAFTTLDLTAFDVIGWTPIPEPTVIFLSAFGSLLMLRRKR